MFTACPGIQASPRSQVGKTSSKQLASSALVWRHIDWAARLHLLGDVEIIVGGRTVDGWEESQYTIVIRRRRVSSYASGHRRWHRSHGGHGHPCQRPSCPYRYTVWSVNLRIDTACPGQGGLKNTAYPGCGSARGRGHVAHDRNPAHGHSPGRGHDAHPVRGHGAHPCAESSRGRRGEGRETGRAGGIGEDGGRGRGQSRSATTQREGCGPTTTMSARAQSNTNMNSLPRSSTCRRGPSACCASHGRHRRRRDGPRTPQKRTYVG